MKPAHRDWLLAAAFFVAGQIEVVVFVDGTPAQTGLAHGIAAGVVMLAIRRSYPWATAVSLYSMLLLAELVDKPLTETISPFVCVLFGSWAVGVFDDGPRVWITGAIGTVMLLIMVAFDSYDDGVVNVVMAPTFVVWAPLLVGRLVRDRGRLNAVLRERVESLSADRERALEAAVLDERAAIASELHDVVAHALSAMVIQAGAARRAAGVRDEHARDSLAQVELTGREALTELRSLLGVLRREDEDIALAPQPSLVHVQTLVRRAEQAGASVRLEIEGERPEVPAGVDLTGYRLIQEALRRAVSGRPDAHADVRVRYGGDGIVVDVADDVPLGAAHVDSTAFLGIQERVTLYGGRLRTTDSSAGGHRVTAELPLATA